MSDADWGYNQNFGSLMLWAPCEENTPQGVPTLATNMALIAGRLNQGPALCLTGA